MLPFFNVNLLVIRGDPSQLGVFLRSIDIYLSSSIKRKVCCWEYSRVTVEKQFLHKFRFILPHVYIHALLKLGK